MTTHISVDLLAKINDLHLPYRFEAKLTTSIEYLLSSDIPELETIILFGSCARNQIRVTSDIDLLVITTSPVERMMRGEISSVLEEELDGVHADVIFYTREQYDNSTRLFTIQVKTDGIILYTEYM